jgi:hypothetical protein
MMAAGPPDAGPDSWLNLPNTYYRAIDVLFEYPHLCSDGSTEPGTSGGSPEAQVASNACPCAQNNSLFVIYGKKSD